MPPFSMSQVAKSWPAANVSFWPHSNGTSLSGDIVTGPQLFFCCNILQPWPLKLKVKPRTVKEQTQLHLRGP